MLTKEKADSGNGKHTGEKTVRCLVFFEELSIGVRARETLRKLAGKKE